MTSDKRLFHRLNLPVEVLRIDDTPKILAGGLPVIPFNSALKYRQHFKAATDFSLATYVRAAKLYIEFTAHLGLSIFDVTNQDFRTFMEALQGRPFRDTLGAEVRLSGIRSNRTSDLMVVLLYSMGNLIEREYMVAFEWLEYEGFPQRLINVLRSEREPSHIKGLNRRHRIKWYPQKVNALPDEQLIKLLEGAQIRWADKIPDGDRVLAEYPERQRGALFYRNSAMLLIARACGARRSEIPQINLEDIDKSQSLLYLVTKGHGGPKGERLAVVLPPIAYELIWIYITRYRPQPKSPSDSNAVFLSHSTRNYGQRISYQTPHTVIRELREQLEEPWRELCTLQTLRHRFGVDLQEHLGSAAIAPNMRHRSLQSIKPYSAGVEVFAKQLLPITNSKLERVLSVIPPRTGKDQNRDPRENQKR